MDTTSWSYSPHWGTFWGQFTIELTGGILGSFTFLFVVLIFLKPKVKIADFLCKIIPSQGEPYYIFKLVNRSFFDAHDLTIELHSIRRIPMGNGYINNEYSKLTLLNGHISQVPARPFFWRNNKANPHCIIVHSTENLNKILSNELHGIMLRVSLKHGLTGLSNVFEQEYANETEIKSGKFKPGSKFGVV
jgi:hypothetical protein